MRGRKDGGGGENTRDETHLYRPAKNINSAATVSFRAPLDLGWERRRVWTEVEGGEEPGCSRSISTSVNTVTQPHHHYSYVTQQYLLHISPTAFPNIPVHAVSLQVQA